MSQVFPSCSYITAAGDEIFLNKKGDRKIFELYVRYGFGAPKVKTEERKYADGSVRTLAVLLQPRDVGLELVVDGETTLEKDEFFFDLVSRLLQIGTNDEWGHLKIKRNDGTDVILNCVYTGGFDEVVDCYKKYHQFKLTFRAGDSYFYDAEETVFQPKQLSQLIYLNDNLFLGDWTLKGGLTDLQIHNTGELCFPIIEVTGPASVIRIKNETTKQTLAMATDFSLAMGEVLLIDCREHQQRGITLRDNTGREQDITNKLGLGSSLNWPLVKGTNVISLYYTDSAQTSSYRLRFRKRYYSA